MTLLLLLGACGSNEKQAPQENVPETDGRLLVQREQFNNRGMALGQMEDMELGNTVTASGRIDVPPENKAVVSAYHAGYIKAAPLLVGDQVRAGQVLLTLENPEFVRLQQEYLEIAGQMDFLRSEYERQQVMLEEKISSRKNFLQAESNYRSALATYNGLKKKLELLHLDPAEAEAGNLRATVPVLAPISGSISQVDVGIGMFVSPSDPIMEIVNTDHLHLELMVFEKDLLKIQKGQHINFRIPEATGDLYQGEVYLVGSSLDPETRSIKVHGHLEEDAPANLAVGMFVDAGILTGSKAFKVLPEEAIIKGDNGYFVFHLQEEDEGQLVFRPVAVEIGQSSGGYTAVLNAGDFPEGSRFLTRGGYSLLAGS